MDITEQIQYEVPRAPAGSIFFITGGGGTGKSYQLKALLKGLNNVLICAFTGNAALLVGGKTINSLFGVPTDGLIDPNMAINQVQRRRYSDKSTRFFSKKKTAVLAAASWIVIDEAGMPTCYMIDFVDKVMRAAKKNPLVPFGGCKVILVGDRAQIPPIVSDEDKVQLDKWGYKAPYDSLESQVIKKAKLKCYFLTKIWRQENVIDGNTLNRIRIGTQSDEDLERINKNISKIPPVGSTILCSLNKHVNAINSAKLNELNGELFTFESKKSGTLSKKIKDAPIRMKRGARVIISANGKFKNEYGLELEYVNGDQGVFEGVDKKGRLMVTRDRDNELVLLKHKKLEDIEYFTETELVEQDDGCMIPQEVIHEKVKGKFSQFPLRLGYAMSLHKSQGQTLQRVHIMLGNVSNRVLKIPGLLYTGLSRVTSLEQLSIDRKITHDDIKTSPAVLGGESIEQYELDMS